MTTAPPPTPQHRALARHPDGPAAEPSGAARPSRPAPARLAASARRLTGAVRRAGARLGPDDRAVLGLYLLTRLGLWITAYCTGWILDGDDRTNRPLALPHPWERWDWWHYLHIARSGYFPDGLGPWSLNWDNREAFFPGFPLALRAVHAVVRDWTAAGLLISFAAGAVAVLSLARLARRRAAAEDRAAGRRAAFFLLLSPCAVFLAAGYTEALFLALALPAWHAALRHRWALAGVLAALACTVRVSGLFVAAAVGAHFLLHAFAAGRAGRGRRVWRSLPWTFLPAVPAVAFSWYLHTRTGDWMAWKHAEERGWYRGFHAPWTAWAHTWHEAFGHAYGTDYALLAQAELLAMAVGLALLVLLAVRRRWAEAVYLGLSLWALGTSYWYESIPRAALLWWPLWTLLATAGHRRPWLRTAWLCLSAPLMTVFAVTFFAGRWAG